MDPAPSNEIIRFAQVLTTLAARHGLSELRTAGEGRVVATVAADRTLLDIAGFELDAQAVLHADVAVVSSRTALASEIAGPLLSEIEVSAA